MPRLSASLVGRRDQADWRRRVAAVPRDAADARSPTSFEIPCRVDSNGEFPTVAGAATRRRLPLGSLRTWSSSPLGGAYDGRPGFTGPRRADLVWAQRA